MIISISGPAGSGKSTIALKLAEKLGWTRYYIGGLRREKARERGMTLEEYNKLGETDPSTDREVDEYQKKLAEEQDNFILEGRTSWHLIPSSLKVYVDVEEKEGAKRIFENLQKITNERNEGESLETLDSVLESIKKRKASDERRYEKYYGIDVYDTKNYDLVIDTTGKNAEKAWKEAWKAIKPRIMHKETD